MNCTKSLQLALILSIAISSTFFVSIKIIIDVFPAALPTQPNMTTSPPSNMPPVQPKNTSIILPNYFIILVSTPKDPLSSFLVTFYDKSPYIASIMWGLFLFALIYKGKTRSIWKRNGYGYDIFKILAKMRGSHTRIKIMQSLSIPKNKHQLAEELNFDWKSIDGHIKVLLKHELIQETSVSGTARFFTITNKGLEILQLLNEPQS
ncbi:MAG: hypothetical protein KGI09_08465 [Thaumarchaeota archaeon]|nr:hypothetical protein [Nitrososphaerota archaeon]